METITQTKERSLKTNPYWGTYSEEANKDILPNMPIHLNYIYAIINEGTKQVYVGVKRQKSIRRKNPEPPDPIFKWEKKADWGVGVVPCNPPRATLNLLNPRKSSRKDQEVYQRILQCEEALKTDANAPQFTLKILDVRVPNELLRKRANGWVQHYICAHYEVLNARKTIPAKYHKKLVELPLAEQRLIHKGADEAKSYIRMRQEQLNELDYKYHHDERGLTGDERMLRNCCVSDIEEYNKCREEGRPFVMSALNARVKKYVKKQGEVYITEESYVEAYQKLAAKGKFIKYSRDPAEIAEVFNMKVRKEGVAALFRLETDGAKTLRKTTDLSNYLSQLTHKTGKKHTMADIHIYELHTKYGGGTLTEEELNKLAWRFVTDQQRNNKYYKW